MRRLVGLAGLAIACAIGVSACGGGGAATLSIKTLTAAVDNTQAAQSTGVDMKIALVVRGKQVNLHAYGVQTADGKQAQVIADLAGLGSVDERVTADGLYMHFMGLSGFGPELPAGKLWVFLSFDAMKAQTGTDLRSLIDQSQSSNPQRGLEYLQATSGDVTKVGDDTVAGAHATHYKTTIDYQKYADEKLGDATPEVRDKIAALGKVPADVWIDDSDRVVKTHFATDATAFGAPSGTAEMTMEITGFDVPVDVEAPPADQTIDIQDLRSSEDTASASVA